MRACPGCGHRGARRSRRRPIEQWVSAVLPLRPYRCERCIQRFWWVGDEGLWASTSRSLLSIAVAVAALSLVIFYLSRLSERETVPAVSPSPSPTTSHPTEHSPDPAGGSPLSGRPQGEQPGRASASTDTVPTSETPGPRPTPDEPSALPGTPEDSFEPVEPEPFPDLPPARPSDPRRPELLGIRLVPRGAVLDVELLTDERPRHWNIFQLDRRLVIDLQGPWIARRQAVAPFDHPLVDGLRIGQHEDQIRIVVDLLADDPVTTETEVETDRLRVRIALASR